MAEKFTSTSGGTVVVLDDPLLRQLARTVAFAEQNAIMQNGDVDRDSQLADSTQVYKDTLALLDNANAQLEKHSSDAQKSTTASDIYGYVKNSANMAVQYIRNFRLRRKFVSLVADHASELSSQLDGLLPSQVAEFERLAQEAATFRTAALKAMLAKTTNANQAWIEYFNRNDRYDFGSLRNRYQARRGYEKPFDQLEDWQKAQVYDDIIEASGRPSVVNTLFSDLSGAAGAAFLVFMLGTIVWDTVTSSTPVKTAIEDTLSSALAIGGSVLGDAIGAALAEASLPTLELEGAWASAYVFMASAGAATAGAALIAVGVVAIVEAIFSLGSAPAVATYASIPKRVLPMPDGHAMAVQLAPSATTSSSALPA